MTLTARKMAADSAWMVVDVGANRVKGHFTTKAAALACIDRLARDAKPIAASPDPLLDRFFRAPQRPLLDRLVCP